MKKSKSIYIVFAIVAFIIIGFIVYFYVSNTTSNNQQNYSIQRTSIEKIMPPKETEISSFSTEILDDSEGRLNNIKITCDKISGTIIDPGKEFSFNTIVGQPTKEDGYEEAAIIVNHHREEGIGGGNCQVSSTLYNAVLTAGGLTVTERHEHGEEVGYLPLGKDATVSYGSSLDFKFKNDNNYKIKIAVSSDNKNITAKIYKVEE